MIKDKVTKSDYPEFPTVLSMKCVCGGGNRAAWPTVLIPACIWALHVGQASGHGRPIPILSLSCEESLLFLHIPRQGMPGMPQMWEDRGVAGAHTCSRFWFRSTRSSWSRGDAASLLPGGGALRDYSCT